MSIWANVPVELGKYPGCPPKGSTGTRERAPARVEYNPRSSCQCYQVIPNVPPPRLPR